MDIASLKQLQANLGRTIDMAVWEYSGVTRQVRAGASRQHLGKKRIAALPFLHDRCFVFIATSPLFILTRSSCMRLLMTNTLPSAPHAPRPSVGRSQWMIKGWQPSLCLGSLGPTDPSRRRSGASLQQ